MKDGYGTPKPTPPQAGTYSGAPDRITYWYGGMPYYRMDAALVQYNEDLANWERAQT